MKAFGKRARGALAALLSAALITSGALLAAPAAYAEDSVPSTETPAEVVTTEAPAEEAAADEAPADEAPAHEVPSDEVPVEQAPVEGGVTSLATTLLVAPTALSTPRITLTPNPVHISGGEVIVRGENYDPNQAIYVFLCGDVELPANLWDLALLCRDGAKVVYPQSDTNPSRVKFAADGSFSLSFDVKQLDGAATAVYTAANHTAPSDRTQDAKAVLNFKGATPSEPEVPVIPSVPTPGPGTLFWGVSSDFASYVTGSIAKGRINTSGVGASGAEYAFPQSSSNWNAQTRTGTVRYSGSVNYWGHSGAIDMTFANPVITVTSPLAGTITAGGQTFPLNLAAARFTENADGSVTWSSVPVSGAISGGDGGSSGGTVDMDDLSFTVGSASNANFGSTVTTSPSAQERTPAAAPPATTGLTVVTDPVKLVPGGEIEITASGFQPNESGILVVLYSDPTVLDKNAKADANGVVRWIGKLPAGVTGTHTITLQGSINVGKEITIAAEKVEKEAVPEATALQEVQAAGPAPAEGTPAWVWWTAALALLVLAGVSTGLVVAQHRRNGDEAPTRL